MKDFEIAQKTEDWVSFCGAGGGTQGFVYARKNACGI
jgi:hypothetical protein